MTKATRMPVHGALDLLLSHRILFVAGKGGTGKTTTAAALSLLAARRGMRVLGIEVDAKGDLARALGAEPVGFTPAVVQSNISVLALHPEDSLREYLKVFFKVPRFVSVTPLSRIFDFVATSVPGPKDMLVVGKIAYEERQTAKDGSPRWDLIVVDCSATGHAMGQLLAAREMRKLTRGGMIRSQLEWIDSVLTDKKKTALIVTALPQEMAVVEAVELVERALKERHVALGACFLNRMPPAALPPKLRELVATLESTENRSAVDTRLAGSIVPLREGLQLATMLHSTATKQAQQLHDAVAIPIIPVPLIVAKDGLATSRAVAAAIAEATR